LYFYLCALGWLGEDENDESAEDKGHAILFSTIKGCILTIFFDHVFVLFANLEFCL
jgi:hypothetical protein